jgi:hypothetical protein
MAKQNSSFNLSLLFILFLGILLASCNKKSSNEEYNYDNASSPSTPNTTTNTSTLNITTTNGSIISNPPGIDCGSDCSESYTKVTSVQLTATSKNSYKFSSWGGDCSGSNNPLTVAMDKDKICSASFTRAKKLTDTGQTVLYCGTSDFPSTSPCGEDSDYLINPPSFTVTDGGDTVTDNNTGLIWQRKGNDGCNGQKTCKWEEAKAHCNSLSLAGKKGWRLPDSWELLSIVNYGKYNPAIDPTYFSDTASGIASYWSSTVDSSSKNIWSIYFRSGSGLEVVRSESRNVRCVWGSQLPVTDLLNNNDGTVTDRSTGLIWQQNDDRTKHSWKDSLTYCEGLELPAQSSQKDWRLPNIKELDSIIDRSRSNPVLDTTFFPINGEKSSQNHWTSTVLSNPNSGVEAWYVNFWSGVIGNTLRSNKFLVLCVRGGQ